MAKIEEIEKEVGLKCNNDKCGKVHTKFSDFVMGNDNMIYCECGYCFGELIDVEDEKKIIKEQITKSPHLKEELKVIDADIDRISRIIRSISVRKIQIESLTKRIKALQKKRGRKKKSAIKEWEFLEDTSKKGKLNDISKKRMKKILESIVVISKKDNAEDKEQEVLKHIAEPTSELAKFWHDIDFLREQLYDLTGSTTKIKVGNSFEDIAIQTQAYLDYGIKRLRKHFIAKTGRPRNDLIAGLFLRFNFIKIANCEGCKNFKDNKCSNFLECKKAQDRIKQRSRSLDS